MSEEEQRLAGPGTQKTHLLPGLQLPPALLMHKLPACVLLSFFAGKDQGENKRYRYIN